MALQVGVLGTTITSLLPIPDSGKTIQVDAVLSLLSSPIMTFWYNVLVPFTKTPFYYLDLSLDFFAGGGRKETVASQGLSLFSAACLTNGCTNYPCLPISAHLASLRSWKKRSLYVYRNVARLFSCTRNLFLKIRFAELGGKLDLSGSASYPKKAPEIEKRLVMCIPAMELRSAVCLPFVFRECMT